MTTPIICWSPVDMAPLFGITNNAGDKTTGIRFSVYKPGRGNIKCTGIRFRWAGGARSIKVTLWRGNYGGADPISAVATKTNAVIVTGPGIYSILFDTPYTLVGTDYFGYWRAAVYDTTAVNYTSCGGSGTRHPDYNLFWAGPNFFINQLTQHAVGDARPTLETGVEEYPVEPILELV